VTRLLQDYAAEAAQARGDAGALELGDETVSHGQLDADANRLAWLLAEHGLRGGERVALFSPKRPAAVTAMLATLKAGCAYVPIDLESPPARLEGIVGAADARAVLVAPEATPLVDELIARGGLRPDVLAGALGPGPVEGERFAAAFGTADGDAQPAGAPPLHPSPDSAAHVLFTSGSTGAPKGVVITHANARAFVDWAVEHFRLREDDRLSGHPPLHFDLSTFDIYGTLAAGARLHMVPPQTSLSPPKLASFMREHALTQWFSVPSLLTYLARFDAIDYGDFPALRRLLWCGEVLPTPVLSHWMRRLPHVSFTNLYGPTEATIASSHHTVLEVPADDTPPVPIGRACPGEELLVLDRDLKPARPGEIGDLYIAGVGLSPGYWNDLAKTAEVFLDDPRPGRAGGRIYRTGDLASIDADGVCHFVGRADSQVKSRGHRIELGEVEAALDTVPGLRESAVVGVDSGGFEGTTICCAYVGSGSPAPRPAALRRQMSNLLPRYMLPSRWLDLDSLPKNANGKVDRPALRALFTEQVAASERAHA